jgi:large subunit ribosomal protein L15
MDISQAKKLTERRERRKRVGRGPGSGSGKTSGRGQDGARSRSGWSVRGITGGNLPLWQRLPKRGFSNEPFKKKLAPVNVERLNKFADGEQVGPEELRRVGILSGTGTDGVKILGEGELARQLTVRAHAFSRSAVAKIEAAGGTVELIAAPRPPVRNKMRGTGIEVPPLSEPE